MKPKKINKILSLRKNTIADLNAVKGGRPIDSMRLDCLISQDCQTFNLTNCWSWEFPACVPGSENCESIINVCP